MKVFQIQTLKMPTQCWKPWAGKISAIKTKKVQLLPEVVNGLRSTSQMEDLSHKMESFWKSLKSNSICLKDCPLCNQHRSTPIYVYIVNISVRTRCICEKSIQGKRSNQWTVCLCMFWVLLSLFEGQPPQMNYQTQMETTTFPFNFVLFET